MPHELVRTESGEIRVHGLLWWNLNVVLCEDGKGPILRPVDQLSPAEREALRLTEGANDGSTHPHEAA